MVYENCKTYGPYSRKEDDYQHVVLIFSDGKRKTVSYAKFLMEKHLNRYLSTDETVDHIDRNPRNNSIDNLVIRSRSEHSSIDASRVMPVLTRCIWCNKQFFHKNWAVLNRSKNLGSAGPFCNKRCSGQYGAFVQNGGDKLKNQFDPKTVIRYRIKK